ncbi:MAG: hypothetical protein BGO55_00725 [Sphingobacteriales bacterium 50-39]|nr:hypothetical protein [Sphingobacteriales bacterium]OJW53639.1 MAG: hypothetical protein BGO55_00725 [Sphingobacteriales bacterium 50-39]
MKNKISDLRDHMFAQLERLGDEDLSEEDLKKEISRAQAISEVGKVIVESAKTEVLYAKLTGKRRDEATKFLEEGEEKRPSIVRPAAAYSNKSNALPDSGEE